MKGLISTLVFCGTLSLLAGPAMAKAEVSLHCQKGTCTYTEELGPDQTHEYRGFCAGENTAEFRMVCHAVKGTTCTGILAGNKNYWYCNCTNWNTKAEKHVTIDLECDD